MRPLVFSSFVVLRTPPGFAEIPVFASFAERPCGARDLSVFHRLDGLVVGAQSGGVRKRPSDRLRRKPSRGGAVTTRW